MLRIRLSRTGKKKQASFRVVVADKEAKRDGRIVERIGHYNPRTQPLEYDIQEDRALYWLSNGAQPSEAVRRLLDKQGTFERLARFHAGESLESLVAEYRGVDLTEEAAPAEETALAEEAPAEAEAEEDTSLLDQVEDVAADAAVLAAGTALDAADTVTDVAADVVGGVADAVTPDVVTDVVDAITGEDEEE